MSKYKIGDKVKTKHGEFTITTIQELLNPITMGIEDVIEVDAGNGIQRKINNEDILE